MTYTHLTQQERYRIEAAIEHNQTFRQMSVAMGRSSSSLSREVARNGTRTGYCAAAAQTRADARMVGNTRARTIASNTWDHVRHYLQCDLSPQQACERLKAECAQTISHERIYQYIYADKAKAGTVHLRLRCQKVRRKRYASGRERRGVLKNRVGIEQRPAVVQQRTRIGDIEGDTMIGKDGQGVLLTLVDRKSRYTFARCLPSKHAQPVAQAVIDLLRQHKAHCHTLTFDNGKEFADHAFMAHCLEVDVYFAQPYCSWQRGTNENTNGLLRQYFPKSTDFRKVTQSQVDQALYRLNHRPRKCLGYKTPHEAFFDLELRPLKLPSDALRA